MRDTKSLLLCFFLLLSAPSFAQNGEHGKYAPGAPSPAQDWPVPPGHYGLIAGYADDFLSNTSAPYSIGSSSINTIDKLDNFFVLDVRPTGYAAKHLEGAVNIPYSQVIRNLNALPLDRTILVVCQSGLMSGQVGAILGLLGYAVRILPGGIGSLPCGGVVVGTSCP